VSVFETISQAISSKISLILDLDQDKKEILAYGAFIFLQSVWSIFITIIFGLVFGVIIEILIISFTAALLRKYSGGAHATSPNSCAFIGGMVFTCLSYFSIILQEILIHYYINYIYIIICIVMVFCFICNYIILYKYSPVDSPNKRITNIEKRKRLKTQSIHVLYALFLLAIILYFIFIYYQDAFLTRYMLCILLGVTWQSLTLTVLGKCIIHFLDTLLNIPVRYLRRWTK